MAMQKEISSSTGSPGNTPTPPPASGLQTERGTTQGPAAESTETPANQATGFDPSMKEKFFSFMSFYEQHQQAAHAQSNNSGNNNGVTPMSLDGSSFARGNQQPTFAPYEPQRGSRLTLQTYLDNLAAKRDLTGGFRGNRAFATPADEAEWDEQNVDGASKEAGPPPYCSVPVLMDDENPCESINAKVYYNFADNGYVTPQLVNTNVSERIGPNFLPDPEAGDKAIYPEDPNLPSYTQSGLQILVLVTAVHGASMLPEPATVQQVLGGEHREIWHEAMDREIKALEDRKTWKMVPIGLARNKTILTGKWVFRVKTKANRTIDKFKARWVVRGFDQEHGREFTKTFAPVSQHTSLRILIAIAAMKRKKLRQIDVANAFLYAPVDAEIFVEQPHESDTDLIKSVS
ncbi:unnamed protein product [Closterium sp. NIES-53]